MESSLNALTLASLDSLVVENIVNVPLGQMHFDQHITWVTGETGSGKTLLLRTLAWLFGARMPAGVLRDKTQSGRIALLFHDQHNHHHRIERCISSAGRHSYRFNGKKVSADTLKAFRDASIQIQDQSASFYLLNPENLTAVLDSFAKAQGLVKHFEQAKQAYQQSQIDYAAIEAAYTIEKEKVMRDEEDKALLEALNPLPDEWEHAKAKATQLHRAVDYHEDIQKALDLLEQEKTGLMSQIYRFMKYLDKKENAACQAALEYSETMLQTAQNCSELLHEQQSQSLNCQEIEQLETRIADLEETARRLHISAAVLYEKKETLTQHTQELLAHYQRLETAKATCETEKSAFEQAKHALLEARTRAIPPFCAAIKERIAPLGLESAILEGILDDTMKMHLHFSAHPKHPPLPVTTIASGGERSRITLALNLLSAHYAHGTVIILDEPEIGLGGETLPQLQMLLQKTALHSQIICITHAATLACGKGKHYRIIKDLQAETATSIWEKVDAQQRAQEIARLLCGNTDAFATEHAQRLLEASHSA